MAIESSLLAVSPSPRSEIVHDTIHDPLCPPSERSPVHAGSISTTSRSLVATTPAASGSLVFCLSIVLTGLDDSDSGLTLSQPHVPLALVNHGVGLGKNSFPSWRLSHGDATVRRHVASRGDRNHQITAGYATRSIIVSRAFSRSDGLTAVGSELLATLESLALALGSSTTFFVIAGPLGIPPPSCCQKTSSGQPCRASWLPSS